VHHIQQRCALCVRCVAGVTARVWTTTTDLQRRDSNEQLQQRRELGLALCDDFATACEAEAL
jgi:hypothetical protein